MAVGSEVMSKVSEMEECFRFMESNSSTLKEFDFVIKEDTKQAFLGEIERVKHLLSEFEKRLLGVYATTDVGSKTVKSKKTLGVKRKSPKDVTSRTRFTIKQKRVLQEAYNDGTISNKEVRQNLSKELGVTEKIICQWRANRRRRSRSVKSDSSSQ